MIYACQEDYTERAFMTVIDDWDINSIDIAIQRGANTITDRKIACGYIVGFNMEGLL